MEKTESCLTEEILTAVKSTKKVTTSFLQRKFGIGYGRAARILDELIEKGIIEKPQEPKVSKRKRTPRKLKEAEPISDDVLLEKVVELIKSTRKVSTSLLQRKFGIGYGRAAMLIDTLERNGLIGPDNGLEKREIFI